MGSLAKTMERTADVHNRIKNLGWQERGPWDDDVSMLVLIDPLILVLAKRQ